MTAPDPPCRRFRAAYTSPATRSVDLGEDGCPRVNAQALAVRGAVPSQRRSASIAFASRTSRAESPPASCVESVISTRFQTLDHSG